MKARGAPLEKKMEKHRLDRLFNPRSLALVGASGTPGKWGFFILFNILKGNYTGRVYPVNPGQANILGLDCYKAIADIPDTVDLALITTPAAMVPALIDEVGAAGVPNVVVITSDFSETGPEGEALEVEVVARARRWGMRLVGPNTMGVFSAQTNLHALMPPVVPLHGPVSMFSQSGNVGVQMLFWGIDEGIGFNKFVSSGNEGDLTAKDYLEYFAADKATQVIAAYLEGLDPNSGFFETARKITAQKPVAVLKGGRTRSGGRAAASHSGALAGASNVVRAAFKQAGIIQAEGSQELMDVAKALSVYPVPRGKRVGILTRGGGWGVLTADACEENGLDVVPLPDELIAKFDAILPKYWSKGNPVDTVASVQSDPYVDCLRVMAEWDGVDAVLALGGSAKRRLEHKSDIKAPEAFLKALRDAVDITDRLVAAPDMISELIRGLVDETGKPIISVSLGTVDLHMHLLKDYGVVSFPTPERAVRVLKLMADYGQYLQSVNES